MKREGRFSAVAWLMLFAVCMAGMLTFAANKTIVIAEISKEESTVSVNVSAEESQGHDSRLLLRKTYGVSGSFSVPLPKGIRAENVTMENCYMERELRLYVQGAEGQFYAENAISGDILPIRSGYSEQQEDGLLLRFSMEHIYEYHSTLNGELLTIEWCRPGESFAYLVILDPAGCEEAEEESAEITLQVARKVQKLFSSAAVRMYCTRQENGLVSVEDRIALAEELGADLYIRLSVRQREEQYGIAGIYEGDFIIPDFGSPELADLLTRETTISSGNRALGLTAAQEDSLLKQLRIPAAELSLGSSAHPKEAYLLHESSYQEKLAEGIVKATEEALEKMRQSGQ